VSCLLFLAAALCALLGAVTAGWVLVAIGVVVLLAELAA
jgi:hypothetical protein